MSDAPRLLLRLLSAAPTERANRLEAFLTEALAFVCELEPQFARDVARLYGVSRVLSGVETQRWCETNRFDLVLGRLGVADALILENKVGSTFDASQITKYLRDTRKLRPAPYVGSLTVFPETYVPTEDAERWTSARTWRDVGDLLERVIAARGSTDVGRFVAEDLLRTLREEGAIVKRVEPEVLRPNPGRHALYELFGRVASEAVQETGGSWQVHKPSTSSYYLMQPIDRDGRGCLALVFSDARGEIAAVIDESWHDNLGKALPPGFRVVTGEFFDWPARKRPETTRKAFVEAEEYRDQQALLVDFLVQAMRDLSGPVPARAVPDRL